MEVIDQNAIIALAGALLSLVFAYAPGVKNWYDGLPSTGKSLIMLGSLVVVSGALFGLACAQWFGINLTCDQAGLQQLIMAFILALAANQATYQIAVRPYK